MKKFTIFAMLIFLSTGIFAQTIVTKEDIAAIVMSKTYVVLEDKPLSGYNSKIKAAVEKLWTINPYVFITTKEFEANRTDRGKLFLFLKQAKFEKDKIKPDYNFLSIVRGAAVKNNMPEFCSLPLSYNGIPEDKYLYKLEGMIRFMQNHLNSLMQRPQIAIENYFDYYSNKNIQNVKNKELWVVESDLEKTTRDLGKIKKSYSYTVKIVTPENIEKAIAEKNPNVIFLHKVGPEGTTLQARCYKLLIGAGDGQLYYANYHTISNAAGQGDGFLDSDFIKIGKK